MTSAGAHGSASDARLVARALVVTRDGRRILDGAALAVRAGEIAVIEGASGSGKSTLLRALALLTPVERGAVLLDGVDSQLFSPPVYRTRVAYVPQQPVMFAGTVADNVGAGPRLRGATLADAATRALLDRVGLAAEFAQRPSRELSGGERHRVALARALANEPSVLLLDEPTAALDPAAALRVLALVRALAAEGRAVAVVTHATEHARALGGARYVCAAGALAPWSEPA